MISTLQFLVNTDNASTGEIETLGEMVKERVKTTSVVGLRWEVLTVLAFLIPARKMEPA